MDHLSATTGSLVCYVNCDTTSFLIVFLQRVSLAGTQARKGWCVHLCFMGGLGQQTTSLGLLVQSRVHGLALGCVCDEPRVLLRARPS